MLIHRESLELTFEIYLSFHLPYIEAYIIHTRRKIIHTIGSKQKYRGVNGYWRQDSRR
jgi:hypothetical protein